MHFRTMNRLSPASIEHACMKDKTSHRRKIDMREATKKKKCRDSESVKLLTFKSCTLITMSRDIIYFSRWNSISSHCCIVNLQRVTFEHWVHFLKVKRLFFTVYQKFKFYWTHTIRCKHFHVHKIMNFIFNLFIFSKRVTIIIWWNIIAKPTIWW